MQVPPTSQRGISKVYVFPFLQTLKTHRAAVGQRYLHASEPCKTSKYCCCSEVFLAFEVRDWDKKLQGSNPGHASELWCDSKQNLPCLSVGIQLVWLQSENHRTQVSWLGWGLHHQVWFINIALENHSLISWNCINIIMAVIFFSFPLGWGNKQLSYKTLL